MLSRLDLANTYKIMAYRSLEAGGTNRQRSSYTFSVLKVPIAEVFPWILLTVVVFFSVIWDNVKGVKPSRLWLGCLEAE